MPKKSDDLLIVIRARDAASKILKSIGGGIGKLAAKARAGFAAVGKAALGVGAAVAALGVGFFALGNSVASAGDNFHKMSQRLGVSTQTLSELAHAADLSGTSIGSVDKGFKTLAKRMSDAKDGLSTAKRSFEKLGLSTTDSQGRLKDLDTMFMEAAGSINKLSSDTEKAAIAQEIFGKSGVDLLPMIKAGAGGIAEMRQEARDLGMTFDDMSAQKSADFIDALARVKGGFSGVKNVIGMELLPAMTDFANGMSDKFKAALPVVKTFVSRSVSFIQLIPEITGLIIGKAKEIFVKFFTDFSYFQAFLNNAWQMGKTYLSGIGKMIFEAGKIILKAASVIWVPVGEAFTIVGSWIRVGWQKMINFLQEKLIGSAIWMAEKLNKILPAAWEFDTSGLQKSLDVVNSRIVEPAKTMAEAFDEGGGLILDMFGSIDENIDNIKDAFKTTAAAIKNDFGNISDLVGLDDLAAKINTLVAAKEQLKAANITTGSSSDGGSKGSSSMLPSIISEDELSLAERWAESWSVAVESISQNFQKLQSSFPGNILSSTVNAFSSSLVGMARAGQMSSREIIKAMQSAAAGTIAAIGAESAIQALFQFAKGLAAMADVSFGLGPPAAPSYYFASAAKFAAIGGGATAAALAIAPRSNRSIKHDAPGTPNNPITTTSQASQQTQASQPVQQQTIIHVHGNLVDLAELTREQEKYRIEYDEDLT